MSRPDPVLVTGAAGFIGRAVAQRLIERGDRVVGVDNLNDYYDPALKTARLATLADHPAFTFRHMDIADAAEVAGLVRDRGVRRIIHLAAQAGVRYSLENPFAYERSNLAGHLAVLEAARHAPDFEHMIYASSSSVYGERPIDDRGFREDDPAAAPASLYAATKQGCELMSQSYAHVYGLPQTGLRFFTVYGPWGRPDMAYYSFTRKMLAGEPIDIYGEGRMARDFTYIDDIVEGVVGALDRLPAPGSNRLLNVGSSNPVGLMDMIRTLEEALEVIAVKIMKPMQPGDITLTYADTTRLRTLTGYRPGVALAEGLSRFVRWYRDHHQ